MCFRMLLLLRPIEQSVKLAVLFSKRHSACEERITAYKLIQEIKK